MTRDGTDTGIVLDNMKKIQAGVISFSETNANWKLGLVRESFRTATNKTWDNSRFRTSSSDWKATSLYKPGGTVTLATGRWSGRVSISGEDPWGMGRFSYAGTTGKAGRKLMFISLYRVGKNLSVKKTGPKTVFQQEWQMLRNKGVDNPNPREQVVDDIINFVKTNQEQGWEVIVSGDVNEDMRALSFKKGIGKLMRECQLYDLHGHLPKTATHISGSTPIDCMIGSAIIKTYVKRAGYTAFHECMISDHRGLFIDIDAAGFYGTKNPDTTRPHARLLKSTNKKSVASYIKAVKAQLGPIPTIMKDIMDNAGSRDEAKARYDTVDKLIGEIMKSAEEKCAKPSGTFLWSTKLKAAELVVRYWKARKSQLKSRKPLELTLKRLKAEIEKMEDVNDDGTNTGKYINQQMRKAKSNLREVRKNDSKHREDFLDGEASEAASKGDKKREKRLKRLANVERMKRSYGRIRQALRGKLSGGVTSLKVNETDEDGNKHTIEITDPEEIQERILERNKEHFKQPHETLFYDSRFLDLLNDEADNDLCEDTRRQ